MVQVEKLSHKFKKLQGAGKTFVYVTALPLEGTTGGLCQNQLWLQVTPPEDVLITTQLSSDPQAYGSQQEPRVACPSW